ncbi:MAG TPA: hypothetical protein VF599_00225 [Pyrinomonadaceae bacterium]|jgi:Tfp pilus assembly protein PilE
MKSGIKIKDKKRNERGVALAIAVIIVAIMAVVALTALTFSSTEIRIAGADLQRTQAFYASSSALEKMNHDFSDLFRSKMRPTDADLTLIENSPPPELVSEGYTFNQSLGEDDVRLNALRTMQNLPATTYPRVNIPEGPYAGLYASIVPYKMSSTATSIHNGTQVKLEREFNNYLVPLFQFGIFSNEDVEIHPGPLMTFNGRIHSNGNVYALRNTKFLNRVTMAGEFIRDATRGGEPNTQGGNQNVWFEVNSINVQSTLGSGSMASGSGTVGGPNLPGSTPGTRGYFPGSPNGIANPSWESLSVRSPVSGTPNRFGGQVLTNTTGATQLKMPLELDGSSPAELIKRSLPSDSEILAASRYHSKSQVRILIDDESAGTGAANVAGIPAGKGVLLSAFSPSPLANGAVLKRVDDSGSYVSTDRFVVQKKSGAAVETAMTVRGVKSSGENVNGNWVPGGAGIRGRILIEVTKPDGTTVDVTQTILSLGMTEGEPNGVVYLQRPLWAAFVQGSRDRAGNGFDLTSLTNNYQSIVDGELIADPTAYFDATRGFLSAAPTSVADDDAGNPTREKDPNPTSLNQIVPINVYNVREGWFRSQLSEFDIYERGMTGVVEINMKNLARWLDGLYDGNLLAGTNALSTNIQGTEGYVVYVSDRRGDRVKIEYKRDGTQYNTTNGSVDNEDIYGPNNTLDAGEDVIDYGWDSTRAGANKKGTLQKDTQELPDLGTTWSAPVLPADQAARRPRAETISKWTNPNNYYRRGIRLFNAEKLSFTAATGKLSPTKGISVASENMVYLWGNYNATGITGIPSGGSTLNDGGFTGAQIPSSIVSDSFFALSKTWFDALSGLYPEGSADARNLTGEGYRMADENLPDVTQSTTVRAGIIAGTNISSLTAQPGRDADGLRRNGGVINFPRFLETWNLNGTTRTWNYAGSFIPLYRSTQALSNWENDTSVIYMPPRRNWSFDQTFLNPNQLPPGTPFFQYVSSTGFRQKLRE